MSTSKEPSHRSLALATSAEYPQLFGEEAALIPALRARGIDAHPVVWNDPQVDWSRFDHVVLRSVWDYFERLPDFLAWLERLERAGVALHNPPSLVRWNLDKHYLAELEQKGVRIVPTVFMDAKTDLLDTLRAKGWDEAVLKPAVSGGAFRTHRVNRANAASLQSEADALAAQSGALLQPFLGEIQTEGEWSLVFFRDRFSHAVLKVPQAGDFRSQFMFGASTHPTTPPPSLVAAAERTLQALPQPALYARVDGILRSDGFQLMEAEVIEPYLFTAGTPGAAERYLDVLTALFD